MLSHGLYFSAPAFAADPESSARPIEKGAFTPLNKAESGTPKETTTPLNLNKSAESKSAESAKGTSTAKFTPLPLNHGAGLDEVTPEPHAQEDSQQSPDEAARLAREKAAEMAEQALHNEALDHYELARAYLSQWNLEMAEMELKASLMCEPGIKVVHRDYVIVSLLRFNPLKALAEIMMVVGLGEPVPFSAEQKTKIKEDNAKAHYEKGIALAREGKWQDAITEYQWAISYHPSDARISRSLAFAYGNAGYFEQAEQEYATSFAQEPGDAFTHADLAFLLDKTGDKQKALEQMKEAVSLQPKATALHVDLGWLAESKGDLELAATEFETAVGLAPRHASLWTHLGKILARQGNRDRAREAYQKALSLDPKQADAEQGLQTLSPAVAPTDNQVKKAS
jgi:Flp pilus assembly protein TadD